ncbi:uncharacterized protein LOC131876658 [Cryptomeria japonica]|uniref:uncharacterized protein LOC131876658 n=1 Tax=Cryptomeria japonica TaxID=3369 RepID=UPI0027DAA602|nr:uncharacterized protein LOC131876658 [Cryptomeria japonica]
MAEFLANISLKDNDITLTGISEVEIKVRPSVLDNLYNWQVFQDDVDLLKFLQFGVPTKIITDNGMCFRSEEFNEFYKEYGIQISHSSPYHPQGNGQAESSNKNILKIIKKLLGNNKKAWDSKLTLALWVDRITVKKSTGKAPFELVYGTRASLPLDNLLPVQRFITRERIELEDPLQEILVQLIELEEVRAKA